MKKHGKPFVKKSDVVRKTAAEMGVKVLDMKPSNWPECDWAIRQVTAGPAKESGDGRIAYTPIPTTNLDAAIRNALNIAKAGRQPVDMNFNGVVIPVLWGDTEQDVASKWDTEQLKRALAGQKQDILKGLTAQQIYQNIVKPNPEDMGRECAMFIKARWDRLPKDIVDALGIDVADCSTIAAALESSWEAAFWRAKALGTELP